MDDETWAKAEKVVVPGIQKMEVINVAFVLPILFSVYLTTHTRPLNLSVLLTYDIFQSHFNVKKGLKVFAEESIKVVKKEASTSAFNQ